MNIQFIPLESVKSVLERPTHEHRGRFFRCVADSFLMGFDFDPEDELASALRLIEVDRKTWKPVRAFVRPLCSHSRVIH